MTADFGHCRLAWSSLFLFSFFFSFSSFFLQSFQGPGAVFNSRLTVPLFCPTVRSNGRKDHLPCFSSKLGSPAFQSRRTRGGIVLPCCFSKGEPGRANCWVSAARLEVDDSWALSAFCKERLGFPLYNLASFHLHWLLFWVSSNWLELKT